MGKQCRFYFMRFGVDVSDDILNFKGIEHEFFPSTFKST